MEHVHRHDEVFNPVGRIRGSSAFFGSTTLVNATINQHVRSMLPLEIRSLHPYHHIHFTQTHQTTYFKQHSNKEASTFNMYVYYATMTLSVLHIMIHGKVHTEISHISSSLLQAVTLIWPSIYAHNFPHLLSLLRQSSASLF